MDGPHSDYLKLLDEVAHVLDQLTGLARKKLDCTRMGDLEELDQCMKREQVFTLSLKGAEKKRAALLAQIGLGDVPLNHLYEHYPAELRMQAKDTVENLQTQFSRYQSAATAARTAMERALRDIEKMMPENQPPSSGEAPPKMRTDIRA